MKKPIAGLIALLIMLPALAGCGDISILSMAPNTMPNKGPSDINLVIGVSGYAWLSIFRSRAVHPRIYTVYLGRVLVGHINNDHGYFNNGRSGRGYGIVFNCSVYTGIN